MDNYLKVTCLISLFSLSGNSVSLGRESEPSIPFERPHAHAEVETQVHLGWESRYFSEGRDALNGDSLLTSSIELGWEHFSAGIWYGSSPDQRYDELQLSLAFTQSIGDLEYYVSYTHFQFPFEDAHDNEVGVGLAWSGLPLDIELSADVYYSFDADGYFAEIAASREFTVTEKLTLEVSNVLGANQGYVSDGHDGANHVALGLGLEYALTDSVSLTAHTAYSWAIDSDSTLPDDDQLIDFLHGGFGLQWSL